MNEKRVCVNCVMDTSDSKIIFDDKGICDHCNTFFEDIAPKWHPDEKGLQQINEVAEKIKKEGVGKEFDCIIGMSGGIDSSYLVYLAKQKLGLRPLVFHVDAGWNSQTAVNNIEKIVDGLDLDLYTEVIDWEEMKDLQLSFIKSGVSHIDTPQDHAFFATMYKFAAKYGVKYILTGGNYSTECVRNPLEWMYYQSDSRQLKDIHRKFGQRKLKNYPVTNILWHKIFLPYVKGIKVLRPLDYLPYDKEQATQFLVDNFGYQRYAQKHFESRFTKFYESYWLPEKFGYDTRKVQYSSLILTGQMTRDEALEKLKKPAYDPAEIEHEFEYVASKLGISAAELRSYFNAPNKTYKDYKNQESFYELGAKAMRALGLEKGGKR
ncbi:N-acetyl sugar amidotransferase [Pseudidiomarina terrestris]|uniref:N-acetyl sugar amidotransferase n=1 Tax=Pseudidiomarina terrestris TaxID=2820060 RepID=UPI00264CECB7|nr:N-acetyl sugar amidotransferase [Pseudidiomarina sp. 1ASP75-5]MDN7134540.1 N-acetyl sugar amidotransferase [Pseudidiomarina sp. 1ASP75-5]